MESRFSSAVFLAKETSQEPEYPGENTLPLRAIHNQCKYLSGQCGGKESGRAHLSQDRRNESSPEIIHQ